MDALHHPISIPLAHILEREGFNTRFPEADDVSELAATIKRMGLMHPPCVIRANDRDPISETEFYYYLIHGHRRVRAMRSLEWTTGPFVVAPPDTSIIDQFLLNLAENIRKDVSLAEIADRCYRVIETSKRAGRPVTSEELAGSIGYSASYLRNLLQLRRGLHPDLWAVMVRTGNRAPVGALLKVVTLPHDEQLIKWRATANAIKEAEGTPAEVTATTPPPPKKASWRSIAVELVKAAPPEYASGARWLLSELGARLGRADILRGLSE